MKRNGIRKDLFLSHVGVAFISLVLITILVNAAVYVFFGGYVREQQKSELRTIAEDLSAAFSEEEGWSAGDLMAVSHRAMVRNIAIQVADAQNRIIWDSSNMMNGHMSGTKKLFKKSYEVPIEKGGDVIGKVSIGTGGMFQGHERSFLIRINTGIWLAFLAVMGGVYVYSKYMSLRISLPLLSMKDTAERMTAGDLRARAQVKEGQSEICELGEALNLLAERLGQQELLRKTMTADIAHELRTPVAAIRSHIEAFQDQIWEPTPEKLEICHLQIMQLTLLIQDLEKLAEAENPMLKLQKEELNIIAVLHEAHSTVQEAMGAKNILYIPPEQKDIRLTADYRRLLQIFINLIGNSYKYTPDGGMVKVRIQEDEPQYITIVVEDTGIGMKAEELPFIFERFYRGEKSRNRKLGGAGIGLSVVKALVEAHGGSISAESSVQAGSSFSVKLPRL